MFQLDLGTRVFSNPEMRVLFVYPSIDTPVGFNHGLAAMSGILKAAGHETRLIHVNEGLGPIPTLDDVLAVVEDYEPGVIGFSAMSQQYPWSSKIAPFSPKRSPAR